MASCSSVLGVLTVFLVFGAITLSYSLPFWVEGTNFNAGLWQECQYNECSFIQLNATDLPRWFNPIRVVSGVSVANALVALITCLSYLTCAGCRYSIRPVQFVILVLVTGGLEMTAAVVTYALKHTDTSYFTYSVPDDLRLGWCFYLAAGSIIGFLIATIFFTCETSNARERSQYQRIQPTTYA